MKVLILLMSLFATTACADELVHFKNGMIFNHTKHQTEKVGLCSACHEKEPGKIDGFGKEWAHKNCIECHDTFKEGPTDCKGCHTGKEFKAK
jgi:hypothetical protein